MICILIKCSASLFNHTVQYASAPVALKLHPSCCYNTVLEVSADHITSLSCFSSSSSLTYSDKKGIIDVNVTYLIWQPAVIWYGISITQSILHVFTLNPTLTYYRIVRSVCRYLFNNLTLNGKKNNAVDSVKVQVERLHCSFFFIPSSDLWWQFLLCIFYRISFKLTIETEPVQKPVTDTACEMLCEVWLMSVPQVSQPREHAQWQ